MTLPSNTQVLIVGAGPVGLTLALLLDRAGVDVLLVDRDSGPVTESRAIWIHSRTLEIWSTVGMTARAVSEGRTMSGIQMRTAGVPRATLPYDGTGTTAHPHALILEQARTQSLLISLLEGTRARLHWITSLESLTQDQDGCTATLTSGDGVSTEVRASLVIGADGGSSTVRKLLGVRLVGGTYDSSFFLADVMASTELNPSMSYLNFRDRSTVAVLPLPETGHFRLIGNLTDQSGTPEQAGYGRVLSDDEVNRLLAANALPLRVDSIGWTSTYRSHHRVAERFREGRILLAGDAGHLHSPAGGLGMNTGIADAANLAWKAAAVLSGAPDELLDTYDAERRAIAHDVVNTSDRIFVLQADTRWPFAFARRNILPAVASLITRTRRGRGLAFHVLGGTAVRYPQPRRRGKAGFGRVRAGALLPLTGLAAIDAHPAIRYGGHVLLVVGDSGAESPEIERIAGERGFPVVRITPHDGRALVGRSATPVIAWVRPDRYVGWAGHRIDDLSEALENALGMPVHDAPKDPAQAPGSFEA